MNEEQRGMMAILTALESTYVKHSENEPYPNAANDAYSAMTYGVGNYAQELLTLIREQQGEIEGLRRELKWLKSSRECPVCSGEGLTQIAAMMGEPSCSLCDGHGRVTEQKWGEYFDD